MKTAFLARWLARLAATAITGLFIAFLVGDGAPDPRQLSDAELAGFGAVLFMVAGTLVAWRRDLPGALLILAGYGAFAFIDKGWPPLPFLVYPVAAALLLLSAGLRWLSRRRHPEATAAPAGSAVQPG